MHCEIGFKISGISCYLDHYLTMVLSNISNLYRPSAYIQGAIEFMKDSVINSKILKQKEVAKLTIVIVALVMLLAMLINGLSHI